MSKIREAYLQRCEIGLLDRERNEGLRLCRENDIVRWGGGGSEGERCIATPWLRIAATNFYSSHRETLPFDIYNPVKHSPVCGRTGGAPSAVS